MNLKRLLGLLCCVMLVMFFCDTSLSLSVSKESVQFFNDVLLPTLLPFLILTGIIVETGIGRGVCRACGFFMRPLFKINGNGSLALAIGILAGFPTGARTIALLYKKNALSKNEAERLLAFANNASPIFIVGVIGVSVLQSLKIGYILLAANILSAISVGMFLSIFAEEDKNACQSPLLCEDNTSASKIFNSVISNSVSSFFNIIGFVMFFSLLCAFLARYLGVDNELVFGLLDITRSVKLTDPYIISVILGFSGLCVFCQVAYQLEGLDLSMKFYLWGKIMYGAFFFLYTKILLFFISWEKTTVAFSKTPNGNNQLAAWLFSISLACIIFALFFNFKED